jgi:serine/threonine protein kinase/formylglycine-generating enzyme required for sulfatase activity
LSQERRRRVRDLFNEALDLPAGERPAFLDDRCGGDSTLHDEVLSLLDSLSGAGDFLEKPVLAAGADSVFPPGSREGTPIDHPDRIGPYRIIEPLGEGGMGTVYLGEQTEPVRRKVAIKVIKLGMDTREVVARFELERQALAIMNHPGIARVFDAGSTEQGQPFFVMERVEGLPVTAYCDSHRLTTRERLLLFLQICEAIQHAHQKGIIHRDIKPSNVLVSNMEGRHFPKIIDFGVARATDRRLSRKTAFTAHGMVVGTPEYMSPEQAETGARDVDTRSDIYTLGVLLYELLVGELPFDFSEKEGAHYSDIQRRIMEEPPPVPSRRLSSLGAGISDTARKRRTGPQALKRQLRGDLDWIIMRAMDKDRTRRYATASEFAADIGRHLDSEPVLAGPPGTLYRFRKFVIKNKGPVAAVLAVVLALAAGFTTSTRLYLKSERMTAVANERLGDYRNLADLFVIDTLRGEADELWPAWPGKLPAMRQWLAESEELLSHLPDHERKLDEMRRLSFLSSPAGESVFGADEREEMWLHGKLVRLVGELKAFDAGDPAVGFVARIRERVEFACAIEAETVGRVADKWERAVLSIADWGECPLYNGLHINPQTGLIPLGRDRSSGLWEFAVHGSGDAPVRNSDGALILTNDMAIVLVLLPGGAFLMGAQSYGEDGQKPPEGIPFTPHGRELPVHEVTLAPFFLSKYELTQGQWRRISGRLPGLPAEASLVGPPNKPITDRHPQEYIHWEECQNVFFHLGLELPTEAQWEYGARAGTHTIFYTGNDLRSLAGAVNIRDLCAKKAGLGRDTRLVFEDWLDDGYAGLAPVGSFRPNAFGIHDTIGNVFEWCRDWLVIYTSPVREGDGERIVDIPNPITRIVRGGSYDAIASGTRLSFRVDTVPQARNPGLGARPARRLIE